jgi:hypothetical protein
MEMGNGGFSVAKRINVGVNTNHEGRRPMYRARAVGGRGGWEVCSRAEGPVGDTPSVTTSVELVQYSTVQYSRVSRV